MSTKSPYREPFETSSPLTVSDLESIAKIYLHGFQSKRESYGGGWELSGSATDSVLGAVLCYTLANRFRLEGIEDRLVRIEQALARIEARGE